MDSSFKLDELKLFTLLWNNVSLGSANTERRQEYKCT